MVRKASRKPGPKSDAAAPSTSSSPRSNAAPGASGSGASGGSAPNTNSNNAPRRGSRVSELKATTRRASLLYQVYDSASVGGATAANAPSPSHAAVVAAAAVLANPSGQVPPSPSSRLHGDRNNNNYNKGPSANVNSNNNNTNSGSNANNNNTDNSNRPNNNNSSTAATGGRRSSVTGGGGPSGRARKPSSGPSTSDDTVLPRPYAKGGSYANENPRLIVSDPLPTTTSTTTTSPASATFRTRGHAARNAPSGGGGGANANRRYHNNSPSGGPARSEEPAAAPRRKVSSRSLPRDASQVSSESGASTRSGASGRPRALSLPRTRESVGEVLPRLRPVRGNNVHSTAPEGEAMTGGFSPGHPSREAAGEALRPSPPPAALAAGINSGHPSNTHHLSPPSPQQQPHSSNNRPTLTSSDSGELREVLSAPPAAFTELTTSTSPRQPARRRNNNTNNNNIDAVANHPRAAGVDGRARELPEELEALSDGGGATGLGSRHGNGSNPGGLFMRSMKGKSASAAPATGHPLPLSPPSTAAGAAAAAVGPASAGKAATKKKWDVHNFSEPAIANEDNDDDDMWGDPDPNPDDASGQMMMFGSTQLLSSLRPSPQNNNTSTSASASAAAGGNATSNTSAGANANMHNKNNSSGVAGVFAQTPPPPRQPAAPSANRPHPSPPPAAAAGVGAGDAAASSPSYKFNVVLSSGKTATTPIALIAGSGCVQGMRPTMEDAHFIELNATHVRGQPVSLMAVLDGHCGRRVADLGAKWLPHYVLHHPALGENNALALVESILQTDREIFHILQAKKLELEQQRKAGRTTGRRRRDVYDEMMDETASANGGSTLIAAAVCGRMLYVACLGDARAVLYDGQTTIAMSEDHKPGNTDESRRIAKCGGFVQFGRVCGILAVSRALGDFEFKFQPSSNSEEEGLMTDFPFGAQRDANGIGGGDKNSETATAAATAASTAATGTSSQPNSQANRRFISNRDLMVSNVADVRQLNLTDASAFLLLACDGLWDVLSNEEATEFVRDFLSYTPDVCDPRILAGEKPRPSPEVVRRVLNNCCQKLTEFAVDRGSMDNVSAMVLFFHDVVDTVARFNGRLPNSRDSRSGNNVSTSSGASSRNSRTRQSRGSVQPSAASSSAFELTNNQLKVRNGRVVARR